MKRPTELYTLLKAYILITTLCICATAFSIGAFSAKNNTEYVTNGTPVKTVTTQNMFKLNAQ